MSSWISPRAVLFAEHFDLKYTDPEPGELEYLLRRIAEGGEPVLELGCGTGRMLLPLLERGIDAAGIDNSEDMLERCRRRLAARGLEAKLRVQSMEALDLPRTFGTVFMGSCGLGVLVEEDDVRATFDAVRRHLAPDGVLSVEIQTPPESGPTIDRAGQWTGEWHRTADGGVLATRGVHRYEPETGRRPALLILERYAGGRLEASEVHEVHMRFWAAETVVRHLEKAGFVEIAVTRAFTDDEPPGDAEWLAVRARLDRSSTPRGDGRP